jgi:hypothetical protein
MLMRRREFITGLGSTAAWPVVARGQQRAAVPVIGWLSSRTAATDALVLPAFHRGEVAPQAGCPNRSKSNSCSGQASERLGAEGFKDFWRD